MASNRNYSKDDIEYGYLYVTFPDDPPGKRMKIKWPPPPSWILDPTSSVLDSSNGTRQKQHIPLDPRISLARVDGNGHWKSKVGTEVSAPGSTSWQQYFYQLMEFKQVHGHCDVVKRSRELGGWVHQQRAMKKRRDQCSRGPSSLWVERENMLDSIGFKWRIKPAGGAVPWEKRFQELVEYKRAHGGIQVPARNKGLYRWMVEQRYVYSQKQKGKYSPMTEERQKKLESIGFVWKSQKMKSPNDRGAPNQLQY